MEPILVTGATGKTGNAGTRELLRRGVSVRALVHSLGARRERLYEGGAEVVTADLFDPEHPLGAMKGTSCAYYCPPWLPAYDLDRFEREQHFPMPRHPHLAADSQTSRAEHVPIDDTAFASASPVPPELRATTDAEASAAWN